MWKNFGKKYGKISIEKTWINDLEEVDSVGKNMTNFYGKIYISSCVNSQVALVFTSIRQVNI
jgi:hypothetical protein